MTKPIRQVSARDVFAIVLIVTAYGVFFWADSRSPAFINEDSSVDIDLGQGLQMGNYLEPQRYRVLTNVLGVGLYRLAAAFDPSVAPATGATIAAGIFTAAAFATLFVFLRALDASRGWALLGVIMAATAFPIVYGYRGLNYLDLDDGLGYALALAALLALFARRYLLFMVITAIGVAFRETMLVVTWIGLFDDEVALRKRAQLLLPAVGMYVVLRLALFSSNTSFLFGHSLMLDHNFGYEGALFVFAYIFAAFGVSWLFGIIGWVSFRERAASATRAQRLIYRSAPLIVLGMLMLNLVVGNIRENRILFAVFPWIIGLGSLYLSQNWRQVVTWSHFRYFALLVFVLLLPVVLFLLIVPGGRGLRLQTLAQLPGYLALYRGPWSALRDRFTWAPAAISQLVHLGINFGLVGVTLLWGLSDRILSRATGG